jgi:lambda family phage portal protein
MSIWREILGLPVERGGVKRRSYQAANTGRLFADFTSSNRSADSELRTDLVLMRNRSRELARNDVYVKRYLTLLKTNVVGDQGMTLQVKARNDDGTMDVIGNTIIENAWAQFSMMGNCTADGRRSWVDLQQYVIEAVARDGEAFIQIVRNRRFPHGIAFHPVEADLIDEKKNEIARNGNRIRMGVEVDEFNRPVAYWVKTNHPGDYDMSSIRSSVTKRIPAESMIHVFEPIRAGQTRGEPWMAPAIAQLKMLNAHREAELVASRMAASKMGFFTSESGDEVPADDYDGRVPIIDAEPGTFHQLPAGVDFKPFDMNHPATAFADFEKGILRGLASGLGVSYASLSNDLEGTSYSSIRQGALEERDAYKRMQKFLLEHFVLPAYSAWLTQAMEFGIVPIPDSRFDKFYPASVFRPRGWQWVDPLKEINAVVVAMHNGVMSMQDVANQYGRDIEETFSQIQRDKELADSMGITLAFQPFGGNEAAKGTAAIEDDSDE